MLTLWRSRTVSPPPPPSVHLSCTFSMSRSPCRRNDDDHHFYPIEQFVNNKLKIEMERLSRVYTVILWPRWWPLKGYGQEVMASAEAARTGRNLNWKSSDLRINESTCCFCRCFRGSLTAPVVLQPEEVEWWPSRMPLMWMSHWFDCVWYSQSSSSMPWRGIDAIALFSLDTPAPRHPIDNESYC